MMLTLKVMKALDAARNFHYMQMYGDKSYFEGHILPCYNLGVKYGADEDTLCAIILHDVLEDCPTATKEYIRHEFGDAVAEAAERLYRWGG